MTVIQKLFDIFQNEFCFWNIKYDQTDVSGAWKMCNKPATDIVIPLQLKQMTTLLSVK